MLAATFLKQSIDLLENRFWNETWHYTSIAVLPRGQPVAGRGYEIACQGVEMGRFECTIH
jgi:hypothetical protein